MTKRAHPHFDDHGTLDWHARWEEASAAARDEGKLVFANLEPGLHEFKLGKATSPGAFSMGGGEAAIQLVGQGDVNDDEWVQVEVVEKERSAKLERQNTNTTEHSDEKTRR